MIAAEVIARELGLRSLTVEHRPYGKPEYQRSAGGYTMTLSCPRIEWETQDGQRFFAFIEPPLQWVTIGSWLKTKRVQREDGPAFTQKLYDFLRSTLGEEVR